MDEIHNPNLSAKQQDDLSWKYYLEAIEAASKFMKCNESKCQLVLEHNVTSCLNRVLGNELHELMNEYKNTD